jgi:predicted hotdog family 3-hydroxylacyl-ACP dehydratase
MPENIIHRIPHRPPMHWLDEAKILADGSIRARRTISSTHPFVVNGMLARSALIEMLAQTAACGAVSGKEAPPASRGMLMALRGVFFAGAAAVGEDVDLHVKMIRSFGNMFLCEAIAAAGGRLLVRGEFSFIRLPAD